MLQVTQTFPHGRRGPVYFTIKTVVADDLVMQRTRSSAAMVLTKFAQNISASVLEVLMLICIGKEAIGFILHCLHSRFHDLVTRALIQYKDVVLPV